MKDFGCLLACVLWVATAVGQTLDEWIGIGNKAYREGNHPAAIEAYRKALALDEAHPIANHNLASALFRSDDPAGAEIHFQKAAASGRDRLQAAGSWYSKGVSLSRQGRTEESIVAYRQSLRLDPSNEWARENLVRAMRERKRKESEDSDKKKDQRQHQGQPPPPMDRKEMQRLLDALREQERKLRQKTGKSGTGAPSSREKDW